MEYKNLLKIFKTQSIPLKFSIIDDKNSITYYNGDKISLIIYPKNESYGKNERELFSKLWYQGFENLEDRKDLREWFDRKCIEWNIFNIWA